LRFSYKTQLGQTLQGQIGSDVITDPNGVFFASNVGQMLVISSPPAVAGTYVIEERIDNKTIRLDQVMAANFTNSTYDMYNITIGRSGFQNGFFTLETAGSTNVPYLLPQGYFDFDYSSHLEINLKNFTKNQAFLGADIYGNNFAKAVLDEFRILSRQMSDVRVGETIAINQDSFTTDALAIRPFEPDSNTLTLIHFDQTPIKDYSNMWVTATKEYMQSGDSINENFGQSLVITDKPLMIDNTGLLSTTSEGTIEFWVSPRYDTYNDPNFRFYFDASGALIEETISLTSGTIKLNNKVGQVLSVRLATDTLNTGTEYFTNGTIEPDFQTIRLKKALPYQQTPVKVTYIPSGVSGDRLSIYKDREGFITFNVKAQGTDYQVRQPIFWERDSWHRIMVSFKFNRLDNKDEIRLFVDGEERGIIKFGQGLLFGQGYVFGQNLQGVSDAYLTADINFLDTLNQFQIGADYLGTNTAQARFDNFKISNIAKSPLVVA
jgi:hypothetical protein